MALSFLGRVRPRLGFRLANAMMSPSPLQRLLLLLLAAAASAVSPAGGGCSTGCDIAVAYYSTKPNQNLTYIGSLFGIDDYRALAAYNAAGHPNQDFVPAGEPVLVNFTCRCLSLPGAPSSTYLAGSFPYRVSPGDTYSSIAAVYNNLTTAAWLEETNSNKGDGVTVNVTVNCSCGDPAVSPDLRMFLTYPLGEGETLVSVGAKFGFRLQSEMDLLRRYNPGTEGGTGSRLVYIPLRGEDDTSSCCWCGYRCSTYGFEAGARTN
ncbi:hypothetical protein PR202_ga10057 [Eleusine coracana subsp. coracana]|uniref:LYK3/RLK10-like LysM domain-containing protein n=1 Tax=Eleusine coracana subsp. coracana TaxID=191504 RepID=A0AAV5C5R0_ELECO|nr:hypothetical protein PR202_ga10057 [Eleusine coracana subsp. coracana]